MNKVEPLRLFEWGDCVVEPKLSTSKNRAIQKLNEQIGKRQKKMWRKKNYVEALQVKDLGEKLKAFSYVGFVQIGKLRIEILPKLYKENRDIKDPETRSEALKNLFSMLRYAGLIPIHKTEATSYSKTDDFFEFLVRLFLDDLEQVLTGQIYHEYQTKKGELTALRGRLDIGKQIRKPAYKLHKFSCIYDEFTIDNLLNRIIKATLKLLNGLCVNQSNRARSAYFYQSLEDVEDVKIQSSDFSKARLHRLNSHYEKIIPFCKLLLSDATFSLGSGDDKFYAILFDMNLVFERYFLRMLKRYYSNDSVMTVEGQDEVKLLSKSSSGGKRNTKPIYPDIILKKNKRNLCVIDTKYKLNSYDAVADIYQMIAYGIATETNKAILVYPKLPDTNEEKIEEEIGTAILNKLESSLKREVELKSIKVCIIDDGKLVKKIEEKHNRELMCILDEIAKTEEKQVI